MFIKHISKNDKQYNLKYFDILYVNINDINIVNICYIIFYLSITFTLY